MRLQCLGTVRTYPAQIAEGKLHRVLFAATGALMSTTKVQQGESIPGISHLVEISDAL